MTAKTPLRAIVTVLALLGLSADLALAPTPAQAHLAKWGSWEITHRNLTRLFPDADPNAWRIKRYQFSEREVELLERELGFELYPEDKTPEFYVAHDPDGQFLGVVVLVPLDPPGVGVRLGEQLHQVAVGDLPAAPLGEVSLGLWVGRARHKQRQERDNGQRPPEHGYVREGRRER